MSPQELLQVINNYVFFPRRVFQKAKDIEELKDWWTDHDRKFIADFKKGLMDMNSGRVKTLEEILKNVPD